ncbi:MAG: hypothetical protein FD164_1369 [Nitrospirae bacterium]|nr:MAG: hypothetical protein FD164_1369 [Nitrospirota bacterium]
MSTVKGSKATKGQLEALISDAVVRFEKDFMGRGPLETKSYIIDDMILVRLKRVLTPAEHQLAQSQDQDGRDLIKKVRVALIEKGRSLLDTSIEDIVGIKVISLHTDISTVTGERIIIFTLASPTRFRQE